MRQRQLMRQTTAVDSSWQQGQEEGVLWAWLCGGGVTPEMRTAVVWAAMCVHCGGVDALCLFWDGFRWTPGNQLIQIGVLEAQDAALWAFRLSHFRPHTQDFGIEMGVVRLIAHHLTSLMSCILHLPCPYNTDTLISSNNFMCNLHLLVDLKPYPNDGYHILITDWTWWVEHKWPVTWQL